MDTRRVLGAPAVGPAGTRRGEIGSFWGWAQLAWLGAALALWSAALLTLPIDADYTSGELLDHLESWRETGVLYPPLGTLPPLRVLNSVSYTHLTLPTN